MHNVRFYDGGHYPADLVAQHLAPALNRGGAVLVFATREHSALIGAALAARGIDVAARVRDGRLTLVDAEEALAMLYVDGELNEEAFEATVGRRVRAAIDKFGSLHAFGEIVDVLCKRGHSASALRLEGLWSHLLSRSEVELLCAYDLGSFDDASTQGDLEAACAEHSEASLADDGGWGAEPDLGRLLVHLERRRRALLLETERRQRAEAECADQRSAARFLSEAARIFASSLDYEATIARVAELAVPSLADWCLVDLATDDGGSFDRVAVGHHRPGGEAVARMLKRRYPMRPDIRHGLARAIVSREPILARDMDDELLQSIARDAEHLRALRALSMRSTVVAPMIARGASIGALSLIACDRNFDERDLSLALQLAHCAAAAIDNARLFEAERRARIRIGKMQEVTAALSRASTAQDVAEVACRIGAEAMEANSGALWLARGDGSLVLAGSWGTPKEFIAQFKIIPANALGVPAVEVLRTGNAVWVETAEDYRRVAPDIFEAVSAAGRVAAYGAVPLFLQGHVAGVICFAHQVGHAYHADERGFYVALAQHCSQALDRARLLDAERTANERLRSAETERARGIEGERAARADAETANRIKDEFLATVSHELRTPLNAISGWASLLTQKPHDAAAVAKGLEVIRRNAQAQTKIVEDILDVSRIITGKLKIDPRPIDMITVVRDAMDVVRPSADAKSVAITLRAPSDGSCLLTGDAERLQQVLWNLLSNAVKFTDSGGRIDASVEQDGPTVVVTVADTGRGISAEFLPHVFERFRQADSSASRKFGGLGLGLAIVRHIVELHGGRASAESSGPGEGSTFRIVIPVREVSPSASLDDLASLIPEAIPGSSRVNIAGMRILVIDDEPDARELVEAALEGEGAVVKTTGSAREALDALCPFSPDIIVSDIGMPGEDGYAFVRALRARPAAKGGAVPAIALTAYARSEDRLRALAAGFNTHVVKPVDARELIAIITNLRAVGVGSSPT